MRVFFSVGEPSGDQHGAHLIQELQRQRPGIECCGFGGPLMERAGCDLLFQLTDLAVMGFLRILPMLGKFYRLVKQAERYFREAPPDAVVLIDFPGFNWWIARKANALGIPVFYYLPPQLWAWAPWRVKRMQKYVDHVLTGLSFERDWLAERSVDAEFVGHPFFDEVADHVIDDQTVSRLRSSGSPVLGILPGSRKHEVERNWPVMLQILARLHDSHPDVALPVACYSDEHRAKCRQLMTDAGLDLPLQFQVGMTPEVVEAADCCFMVSGSVSLELLARTTPGVVLYRVAPFVRFMSRFVMTCDYFTLPNLMVDGPLFPEFLSAGNPSADVDRITETLDDWLSHDERRQDRIERLRTLRSDVGATGATQRAAESILARVPAPARQRAA